jgi:hypothetical protein
MAFRTCRFCGKYAPESECVKYEVRHYAHHRCYLAAGKPLEALKGWQIGEFPFRLLKDLGLLDKAEALAGIG